jgi:biopolymer transport protein ExbD
MAMSAGSAGADEPMNEMNTTPLIDVMLVLLIMFIITLPPPTHSVPLDLPPDCRQSPTGCPPQPIIDPIRNTLYIGPQNQVMWNSETLSWDVLDGYLKDITDPVKYPTNAAQPNGLPELVFAPDPQAPYETVEKVLKMITTNKVTKMGFAGNENYTNEF